MRGGAVELRLGRRCFSFVYSPKNQSERTNQLDAKGTNKDVQRRSRGAAWEADQAMNMVHGAAKVGEIIVGTGIGAGVKADVPRRSI